jgi:hypothetical protein
VLQVQGVGSFAQTYHVDQPRAQIKRKGNSGGDLHRTAGPSPLRAVGMREASQQRSRPPQRGAPAQTFKYIYASTQAKNFSELHEDVLKRRWLKFASATARR